jgi:hypothetical protein
VSRLLAPVLLLALVATPARAQEASSGSGPLVKYGKWALAAGAAGMGYLAAQAHDHANEHFDALESRCLDNRSLCDLDAEGLYVSAESEQLYQESLRYDQQARRWLFAGEVALVGATVLFVWEFTRNTAKPDNIPFEPEVRSLYRATGVGVRIGF